MASVDCSTSTITNSLGWNCSVQSTSATDAGAGTDAVGRVTAVLKATTDAGAGTDAVTKANSIPRSVSDTGAGSDALVIKFAYFRTPVDVAGGTDTNLKRSTFARVASDSAPAVDISSASSIRARSTSDAANGTDVATRGIISFARPVTDAANGTDSVARAGSLHFTTTDSAPAADSVTDFRSKLRTVFDAAGGTDAATNSHITYVKSVSDAASGFDTIGVKRGFHLIPTDSANADDFAIVNFLYNLTVADIAHAVDSGKVSNVVFHAHASDSAGPADDVARIENIHVFINDNAGAQDFVGRSTMDFRNITDLATAFDRTSSLDRVPGCIDIQILPSGAKISVVLCTKPPTQVAQHYHLITASGLHLATNDGFHLVTDQEVTY